MPEDDTRQASPESSPDGEGDEMLIEILSTGARSPDVPDVPRGRRLRRLNPFLREAIFVVHNLADRRMTFQVLGTESFSGPDVPGWDVDFGALNAHMNDMGQYIAAYYAAGGNAGGREAWRHAARELGMHLYHGMLNVDPAFSRQWHYLRRRVRPAENLSLVFSGSPDYLAVPYELMHDGHLPLALRHPVCRCITGTQSPHREPLQTFVEGLAANGNSLKVLLISSGAQQIAADDEVTAVEEIIYRVAGSASFAVTVDVLSAAEHDLDAIRQALDGCPYHIVHYVGQIHYDRSNPAHSGLLFASPQDNAPWQAVLTAGELDALLQGSATQLFYVSAGIHAAHRDDRMLHDTLQLTVLNTLVAAGVPYVIGLRWRISDSSRQNLAFAFYEHLLEPPLVPERAIWRARLAIWRDDPQDEAWASPLLVAQNLFVSED